MKQTHRYMVPDVFDIPDRKGDNPRPWFTAFTLLAIIVGATLALVTVNEVPGMDPQITVSR